MLTGYTGGYVPLYAANLESLLHLIDVVPTAEAVEKLFLKIFSSIFHPKKLTPSNHFTL